MKPAPFEYRRPASVGEACEMLAACDGARLIAGGQTLVPMMAMRLARPAVLVDIGRIAALHTVEERGDEALIGAGVRQSQAEAHPLVRAHLPLLARALPFVGHAPTRNRGTVGGSIANADPAAEIPLVIVTLGGAVRVQTTQGSRTIAARDLFVGPMMTVLEQDACITELIFPIWREDRVGTGFCEISARQSDFAYVAAAAQVALAADGTCLRCAIGLGGAVPVPTSLEGLAADLVGKRLSDVAMDAAVRRAVEPLEIMVDAHASEGYRRRVAGKLLREALMSAWHGAANTGSGGQR